MDVSLLHSLIRAKIALLITIHRICLRLPSMSEHEMTRDCNFVDDFLRTNAELACVSSFNHMYCTYMIFDSCISVLPCQLWLCSGSRTRKKPIRSALMIRSPLTQVSVPCTPMILPTFKLKPRSSIHVEIFDEIGRVEAVVVTGTSCVCSRDRNSGKGSNAAQATSIPKIPVKVARLNEGNVRCAM